MIWAYLLIFPLWAMDVFVHLRISKIHKHPYWLWMSAVLFFAGLMLLFIELWQILMYPLFAAVASFSTFSATACGLVAQRKLLRSLQRMEAEAPRVEEALLSRHTILLRGYINTTNAFLAKAQEILGRENVQKILAEQTKNHIVFSGTVVKNGGLDPKVITANVNKIKREEQPRALFFAFSSLNMKCVETLARFTSPEIAHNLFLETVAKSAGLYETVYTQELPAMLFIGVLEPFLISCKKSAREKIVKEVRSLSERNPLLQGLVIGRDGSVSVEGVYKRVAQLEPEERVKKIVSAFADVMGAAYPHILASLETAEVKRLSAQVISSLSERFPKLWKYGLGGALPADMRASAGHLTLEGGSYLVEGKDPARAFEIFEKFVSTGLPAICVSQSHPASLRERYRLGNARLVWLSNQQLENTVQLTALDLLRDIIFEFMEKRGGVVLLDGVELLVLANGFDQVLRFLRDVVERASVSNATLLIPVNPQAFDSRQLSILERSIEVLREE